ncbi:MAG TPA: aminotransferase class I/II-fold pyridoxal phosphate-dependent enzyme [Thermoanaerobaculia bacterium]|nr:aminotransferase class I/II-fold pyridoxal phosphate-dependent enzyme [Thermoanaerobaculia bacterium]
MGGTDPILDPDTVIREASPALWLALSPLGRSLRQPASFLPLQTAEARGKPFNATIGQITDGRGGAVPLPSMAAAFSGLDEAERSRAFLYSSVEGFPDLRRLWREWQRRGARPETPSSLPMVTVGTAQALALAAELVVAEGRKVVLPDPPRDGDRELFTIRLGAEPILCDCCRGGRFDPVAVSRLLAGFPEGEPAVVVLEFPRKDTGYEPKSRERTSFCWALAGAAEHRPVVAIVDDTWEGLGTPSTSLFWGMIGLHPNLVPIKVDGAEGQLGFAGGRIGFITFPFEPESGIAVALESKLKMLLRAELGSPSAASQVVLLRGLKEYLGLG